MTADEKWNMATPDQYAVSDEVFKSYVKSKNNMVPIDKTNINDISRSYVKINFQLKTSFLKEFHLSRLWDICMQNRL